MLLKLLPPTSSSMENPTKKPRTLSDSFVKSSNPSLEISDPHSSLPLLSTSTSRTTNDSKRSGPNSRNLSTARSTTLDTLPARRLLDDSRRCTTRLAASSTRTPSKLPLVFSLYTFLRLLTLEFSLPLDGRRMPTTRSVKLKSSSTVLPTTRLSSPSEMLARSSENLLSISLKPV